jgi:hypothetical protein
MEDSTTEWLASALTARREEQEVAGALGATLLALLSRGEWIERKSETIEFLSARGVVRTAEFAFSTPDVLASAKTPAGFVDIPLMILPKAGVSSPTATDETGAKVPLRTREASDRISTGILLEFAKLRMSGPGLGPLTRKVAEEITSAATRGSVEKALRASLEDADDRDRRQWEALAADGGFVSLVRSLTGSFLLLVTVPATSGEPRIIRISYEQQLQATLQSRGRSVMETLGWRDTSVGFAAGDLASAQTTEITMRAPEDVAFTAAELLITDPTGASTQIVAPELERGEGSDSVSFSVERPVRGSAAMFLANMRASTSYPALVLAAAIFSAVVLTLGGVKLDEISRHMEPATTLLLAGPTLFTAYVAQPRGAGPGARLLVGARIALIFSALWSFLSAGTIVAFDSCEPVWWTLTGMSWFTALVLVPALLRTALPRGRAGG